MGLGAVKERTNMYLSVAGGFVWDRKADKSNSNYATQEFNRADGTIGTRQGAQYADLTGNVVGVEFRVHDKYGESINITVDSEGSRYIMSISTNNQYSQCFMKALLIMDLKKELFIKPYDFTGEDGKRAQGISFRQDGTKLDLKTVKSPEKFQKEKSFWAKASKKEIKRFFEDLSDYFVAEVEEKVCSQLTADVPTPAPKAKVQEQEAQTEQEAPVAEAQEVESADIIAESKPSVIKMKKFLKEYIAENYGDGETLPKLSKEEVAEWYDLALAEEELPFHEDDSAVSGDDLENELSVLLKKK